MLNDYDYTADQYREFSLTELDRLDAYDLGAAAYGDGLILSDNPYHPLDDRALDWSDGYEAERLAALTALSALSADSFHDLFR